MAAIDPSSKTGANNTTAIQDPTEPELIFTIGNPYVSTISGTSFTTQAKIGNYIRISGEDYVILTIADDTTTNASRYITFTSATTGTISTLNTSSTKLTYNPLLATVSLIGGNLIVSNSGSIGNLSISVLVRYLDETYREYSINIGKIIKGNLKDEVFWD